MTPSLRIRVGGAVVAAALLPFAACTPGGEAPSASPTPTVQPSPPETSLERQQRLDFEAAEKSYRAFMEEYNRLAKVGGANDASPTMKQLAGGPLLEFYTGRLRSLKERKVRFTSGVQVGYVHPGKFSPSQLTLEVCEDGSNNEVVDAEGKQVDVGQILLRSVYVRQVEGRWVLWNGDERGTASSCQS